MFDSAATMEYYLKMMREHPLLSYIEDAFAQFDFASHRGFKEQIQEEFSHVKLGLRQLFTRGEIERFKNVTTYVELNEEQQSKLEEEKKEAERVQSAEKPAAKGKATPKDAKKGGNVDLSTPTQFPEADPSDPNKHKVVPHCASLDLTTIRTMSQMLQYFSHADNFDDLSVVIHDNQIDSHKATESVDLAVGMGAEYLVLRGCHRVEKFNKV